MTPATLEQAELAKEKLYECLKDLRELSGIGIATLVGGYGVKVNLQTSAACGAVPSEIDGVPVIVAIVGVISPL